MFELLVRARIFHRQTKGGFDITSGPLSRLWQFDRRAGKLPAQAEIDLVLDVVGSQYVQLDEQTRTIRFQTEGVQINLGGIGKGHAIDRVAQRFLELGVDDFVIHGGQSSVLAAGDETKLTTEESTIVENPAGTQPPAPVDNPPRPAGWTVGVSHPRLPAVRLAEVTLRNQSLGTSGTERQGFFHAGKRYGHIIDPRNGWPTSHILSSTVVADSAALSDALATAFFVMSVEEVDAFCKLHPEVGAVLVLAESKSRQVSICSFNLEADTLKVLNAVPVQP